MPERAIQPEVVRRPQCGDPLVYAYLWLPHSLEHLAFRVLRENFPELSSEEVHTVVVAAHRVYIERNPKSSAHLKRPGDVRSVG